MTTNIKKKLAAGAVATALLVGGLAGPALAGTRDGTTTCTNGSVNGVRGSQQRLSMITLKLGGVTMYQGSGYYDVTRWSSSGGTKYWWVSSEWLNWSGTYGPCKPPL